MSAIRHVCVQAVVTVRRAVVRRRGITAARAYLPMTAAVLGLGACRGPGAAPTAMPVVRPGPAVTTGAEDVAGGEGRDGAPGHFTRLLLTDSARGRRIPVALYAPAPSNACVRARRCPVAFLSPGRGVPHTAYTFLAAPLAAAGYLVVAVQHDLPEDPPLATQGSLVAIRTPLWARGAATLRFLRTALAARAPGYAWDRLVLVGHSNGGDLSAFALTETPALAGTLVTLDHRRVPVPRRGGLRVLSVRASDFAPDPGVLPTPSEQRTLGYCITRVPGARHDDLQDDGPAWETTEVTRRVLAWLREGQCDEPAAPPHDGS